MNFDLERPIGVSDALEVLRPGAKWYCHQNQVEGLHWISEDIERPTDEEIIQKILELQEEYSLKEYQRQRAAEYPSFADQFDILYHDGYDAWKEEIDRVKEKYPKPE